MKIDLLPSWAQESKRRRASTLRIAAIQVAIFSFLFLSMIMLNRLENRAIRRVDALTSTIQLFDPAWEQVAADAATAISQASQMESFLLSHGTYAFDSTWLTAIIQTVPNGVRLVRMDYINKQITLTATTENIALAEVHRYSIAEVETFDSVQLGRVVGLDNGNYNYELSISVG